jgi:acyl carrier protein
VKSLEQEIKELIITSLSLEDIKAEDIETDAPLFVEGLGLDSIDALELGLALQKRYGITMKGEKDEVRARFASVATLAAYIASQRGGPPRDARMMVWMV